MGSQENSKSSLSQYQSRELTAISHLSRLRDFAERVGLQAATIQLIDKDLKRSKDHRFSVAVVGEFNRGKSTFINALLGEDILPTDILPCSATVNRVTYGLEPRVEIVYKEDGDEPEEVEEIDIDELEDYVTKLTEESEEIAASIKEAVVYYPLAYCENNIDIIDTPGLNDDETMTEVTVSVLPNVSAAIFVIMPDAPFSKYESDFLSQKLLFQTLDQVLFVVTAMDSERIDLSQRERILQTIEARIQKTIQQRLDEAFEDKESEEYKAYQQLLGRPKIFGLSAYQALEAKLDNDLDALAESRFKEFEESLGKFLTHTRGSAEIQRLTQRIQMVGDEILKKITIEAGALKMGREEFEQAYGTALTELDHLRQQREQEMNKIDTAAEKTKRKIYPLIKQLHSDLKMTIQTVIDAFTITPDELQEDSLDELMNRLGNAVSQQVTNVSLKTSEKVQMILEQALAIEVNRLNDVTADMGKALYNIEMKFADVEFVQDRRPGWGQNTGAFIVGGLVSGALGGAVSGYQEAGVKGAAVGGAASLGTAVVGATVLVGASILTGLSLPVSLPAIITLHVVSTFAGKRLSRQVFKGEKVKKFKATYIQQVYQQIDSQIRARHLENKLIEQIDQAFKAVKDQVIGEVDALIKQTQTTLDNMRGEESRTQIEINHKQQEYKQIRQEVTDVQAKAQALFTEFIAEINNSA